MKIKNMQIWNDKEHQFKLTRLDDYSASASAYARILSAYALDQAVEETLQATARMMVDVDGVEVFASDALGALDVETGKGFEGQVADRLAGLMVADLESLALVYAGRQSSTHKILLPLRFQISVFGGIYSGALAARSHGMQVRIAALKRRVVTRGASYERTREKLRATFETKHKILAARVRELNRVTDRVEEDARQLLLAKSHERSLKTAVKVLEQAQKGCEATTCGAVERMHNLREDAHMLSLREDEAAGDLRQLLHAYADTCSVIFDAVSREDGEGSLTSRAELLGRLSRTEARLFELECAPSEVADLEEAVERLEAERNAYVDAGTPEHTGALTQALAWIPGALDVSARLRLNNSFGSIHIEPTAGEISRADMIRLRLAAAFCLRQAWHKATGRTYPVILTIPKGSNLILVEELLEGLAEIPRVGDWMSVGQILKMQS